MTALATRFVIGPFVDGNGFLTLEATQWLQNPDFVTVEIDTPLPVTSGGTGQDTALPSSLEMAGPFYPANPDGTAQVVASLYAGNGVPGNAYGINGDFYFRADGTVGSNLYKKAAGIWSAIL